MRAAKRTNGTPDTTGDRRVEWMLACGANVLASAPLSEPADARVGVPGALALARGRTSARSSRRLSLTRTDTWASMPVSRSRRRTWMKPYEEVERIVTQGPLTGRHSAAREGLEVSDVVCFELCDPDANRAEPPEPVSDP